MRSNQKRKKEHTGQGRTGCTFRDGVLLAVRVLARPFAAVLPAEPTALWCGGAPFVRADLLVRVVLLAVPVAGRVRRTCI